MKPSIWTVMSSLVILLSLANTVSGLMCYHCNSSSDYNCQEMFDSTTGYNPLEAVNCEMYEAKYCIKAIGIWGGIAGTHRFCSAKDFGEQCQYIVYPDHDRVYRACVFTCSSDYCNSTPSLSTPHTLFTLLLIYIATHLLR